MTTLPKKLSNTYILAAAPADKPYKLRPREDGLYLQVNPNCWRGLKIDPLCGVVPTEI